MQGTWISLSSTNRNGIFEGVGFVDVVCASFLLGPLREPSSPFSLRARCFCSATWRANYHKTRTTELRTFLSSVEMYMQICNEPYCACMNTKQKAISITTWYRINCEIYSILQKPQRFFPPQKILRQRFSLERFSGFWKITYFNVLAHSRILPIFFDFIYTRTLFPNCFLDIRFGRKRGVGGGRRQYN